MIGGLTDLIYLYGRRQNLTRTITFKFHRKIILGIRNPIFDASESSLIDIYGTARHGLDQSCELYGNYDLRTQYS